jgi:hypothetical protein
MVLLVFVTQGAALGYYISRPWRFQISIHNLRITIMALRRLLPFVRARTRKILAGEFAAEHNGGVIMKDKKK